MNKKYQIKTNIHISKNFLSNIKIKGKITLIVPKNLNGNIFQLVKNKFNKQILQIIIKPSGEPTSKMVNSYYKKILKPDLLIAIGGGSTLDFAKALSIISLKNKIQYYEFNHKINNSIPINCIPTTCGSGSDISPYSVIINSETKRKFTISDPKLIPKNTYIYPDLLKYINKNVIFASLYDAFSHCLEVYLNKDQNLKIKKLAFKGIGLGLSLLDKKIESKKYKDYMLLALIGGVCITKSRTSIIHTLSVAVSKYYNLPHGLLNLYLTNLGLEFNEPFIRKDVSKIEKKWLNIKLSNWIKDLETKNKKKLQVNDKKLNIKDVVTRMKQDKTLRKVCHNKLTNNNFQNLVKKLNEKNKNFF